jgi:hypothetical protein
MINLHNKNAKIFKHFAWHGEIYDKIVYHIYISKKKKKKNRERKNWNRVRAIVYYVIIVYDIISVSFIRTNANKRKHERNLDIKRGL